ncbi:MAG: 2'-5' RNA ligase family protein [Bacteroidota bacterium]
MNRKISLWLLPVPEQARQLTAHIEQLSTQRGCVPFRPHMTLYSPIIADPDDLRQLLLADCHNTLPLTLQSNGVSHSSAHYRAVVIEMLKSPVLSNWHDRLRKDWNPSDNRPFAPHISLVYQEIEFAERLNLAGQIVPQTSYEFGSLAAIATETSDEAGHTYQEWELLWTLPLSG